MIRSPFNFKNWIEEHRHLLKPPVSNKLIWEDSEFMIFIVAGPNGRTDFHVNGGEEFFYQLEGDAFLRIREDGAFRNIVLQEGDIFLLPPQVPHSPQRPEKTLGLVIERKRLPNEKDGLVWWCPKCGHQMYEEYFHLTNIVTQFKPVFDRFFGDAQNSTCQSCHHQLKREHNYFSEFNV